MDLLLNFNSISTLFFLLSLLQFSLLSSSSTLHPFAAHSANLHRNYTAISDFRLLNRRKLINCPPKNFFVKIDVISKSTSLLNEEFVNVTVSGIPNPSKDHWIAMVTPSNAKYVHLFSKLNT